MQFVWIVLFCYCMRESKQTNSRICIYMMHNMQTVTSLDWVCFGEFQGSDETQHSYSFLQVYISWAFISFFDKKKTNTNKLQ